MSALPAGDVPTAPPPVVEHLHAWLLVADENDGYGQVRSYECPECGAVRYL